MLTLEELAHEPAVRTAYQKWLQDPMTVAVRELAAENRTPGALTSAVGATLSETALLNYGRQLGYCELLAFIFDLERVAAVRDVLSRGGQLQTDYADPAAAPSSVESGQETK